MIGIRLVTKQSYEALASHLYRVIGILQHG